MQVGVSFLVATFTSTQQQQAAILTNANTSYCDVVSDSAYIANLLVFGRCKLTLASNRQNSPEFRSRRNGSGQKKEKKE